MLSETAAEPREASEPPFGHT